MAFRLKPEATPIEMSLPHCAYFERGTAIRFTSTALAIAR